MCVWSVLCVQSYEAFLCAIPVVLISVVSFQLCAFIFKACSHARLSNWQILQSERDTQGVLCWYWHTCHICVLQDPYGITFDPTPIKLEPVITRGSVEWSCSRIIEEQVAVLKYSPEAARNLATAHNVRLEDGLEAGKGARAHGAEGNAQKGWSVMSVEESSGKDGSLLEADQEGKQEAGRWGETTERPNHHN